MRITNRLRAIRDREVRWVSQQSLTGPSTVSVGQIIPHGPYARWSLERHAHEDRVTRV